jgi:hypothetical protein
MGADEHSIERAGLGKWQKAEHGCPRQWPTDNGAGLLGSLPIASAKSRTSEFTVSNPRIGGAL